jgi:hypothetical protein
VGDRSAVLEEPATNCLQLVTSTTRPSSIPRLLRMMNPALEVGADGNAGVAVPWVSMTLIPMLKVTGVS